METQAYFKQKKKQTFAISPFSIFFEIQTITLLLPLEGSGAGAPFILLPKLIMIYFFTHAKIKLSISLNVVTLVGQSIGRPCVRSFPNYMYLGGGVKYAKL